MPKNLTSSSKAPENPFFGSASPLVYPQKTPHGVSIPERWFGPMSGAPFEARVEETGLVSLGVGVGSGSMWISCEDGESLYQAALRLDTALSWKRGQENNLVSCPSELIHISEIRDRLANLGYQALNAGKKTAGKSLLAASKRIDQALMRTAPNHLCVQASPLRGLAH